MPFGPTFCRAREHGCTTSTRRGAPNQKIIRSIATSSSLINQCERFRDDDDEYSVIPKSFFAVCWLDCCAANWLARVFFDGALAEAPASARPVKLTAANSRVSTMAARRVVMVSSNDPKRTSKTTEPG